MQVDIATITCLVTGGTLDVTITRDSGHHREYRNVYPESMTRLQDYLDARNTMLDFTRHDLQVWYVITQ